MQPFKLVMLPPQTEIARGRAALDERRYQILADNCRAFGSSAPLRNVVDKAAWF
jgi:hypothetical protein